MNNTHNTSRTYQDSSIKWKWILAWLVVHPIAATPLVMMVAKVGAFAEPFVANGPVVLPAILAAVLPFVMLLHGSGLLEPVRIRN